MLTEQIVVADASPLIALCQIGQLDLLPALFGLVQIPPAVAQEIEPTMHPAEWLEVAELAIPAASWALAANLGAGESQAISLALELEADFVILDDRPARRHAAAAGLNVVGTLGLLVLAKRQNLLPEVRPWLDALERHEFRMSHRIRDSVLRSAGEED